MILRSSAVCRLTRSVQLTNQTCRLQPNIFIAEFIANQAQLHFSLIYARLAQPDYRIVENDASGVKRKFFDTSFLSITFDSAEKMDIICLVSANNTTPTNLNFPIKIQTLTSSQFT